MQAFSLIEIKDFLTSKMENDLPGLAAHKKMLPPDREFPEHPANYISSSVLIPVFPDHNEAHILFIKRPEYNGVHSSQVALPGGKMEPQDKNRLSTALRETYEEVGIKSDEIVLTRPLSALPIPVSNMMVYPFVGILKSKPRLIINPYEVAYTIQVSIRQLIETPVEYRNFIVRETRLQAPGYPVKNEFIWGATAMIITEFLDLIKTMEQR